MPSRIEAIDVSVEELERLVEAAGSGPLPAEGQQKLKAAVRTLAAVVEILAERDATIQQLRRLLSVPRTTEKTRKVLDVAPPAEPPQGATASRKKGHGRRAAGEYVGAQKVNVTHPDLHVADRCPECWKGKVYPLSEPKKLVRIVGRPPLQATVYEFHALRCNLCGEVFTPPTPSSVGPEKYDATAVSMIAVLKYGSGVPWYRLEGLESHLGIPLPVATQWEIVAKAATKLETICRELIRQAAQGQVLHNDDTSMRILGFQRAASDPRTGLFTSGIVSVYASHRIALFFTGRQHAGENLIDLLRKRAAELPPPIQMCDALSRNAPEPLRVILGNCLAHARRHFIDVVKSFPAECRHVLETLATVFHQDALARQRGLTADQRLQFHQQHSQPHMGALHVWCQAQLEERKVEPNSGLGKAIQYLLRHWPELTLFLRQAGAPLDNNLCERALKKAILHRKNALFYRTQNGAKVGDLWMSLIHTAELNSANPFDYMTALLRQPDLKTNPAQWMPWNYRATLVDSAIAA
jgi:transposase